ncbi:hypothetical protein AMELA_G00174950 [Ameiurus melas]|uniref:Uncharacterized protein n=1 Tax=Ameiurus melas TaxID=219545 RepID=A0A7J6AD35_AMEME|nr:hypothetical protein AMELA_G00174950 [Ameiurus melas]
MGGVLLHFAPVSSRKTRRPRHRGVHAEHAPLTVKNIELQARRYRIHLQLQPVGGGAARHTQCISLSESGRVSLSDSTPLCLCWKSRKTSTAGRNGDINVTQHGLLNKRV